MTTVTATRIVPADPASTALLLAGPSAVEFWPGISGVDGLLSPLSASAPLAGDDQRRLVIRSEPPRRTATSYVTTFSVAADGLPTANGTIHVARQGWLRDGGDSSRAAADRVGEPVSTDPDLTAVSLELRTDVDYDAGVEQEIASAAAIFLDNLAAFAGSSYAAA